MQHMGMPGMKKVTDEIKKSGVGKMQVDASSWAGSKGRYSCAMTKKKPVGGWVEGYKDNIRGIGGGETRS